MGNTNLCRALMLIVAGLCSNAAHAASCHYKVLNEWNAGFTVQVVITNDTAETIDGWSVSWDFKDGSTVSQIWKASLEGGGPYTASSLSYNSIIAPNDSVDFGFNGRKATMNAPAAVPALAGICADAPLNRPPEARASASPERGTVPFEVTFDGSGSSDPDGDSLTYLWNFGNGETATDAVVTRTFDQAGSYPVSLTVNDGQVDSDSVSVTVVADAADDTLAYGLDPARSSLQFVSTKNVHVIETHSFATLSGAISKSGAATLTIDLNSVETGIAIRNQRMRDLLFETATFPEATVSLSVDMAQLANLAVGESEARDVAAVLNLHGITMNINTQVFVTRLSAAAVLVQNADPIILQAADYDMGNGVNALRDIANLSVISYAVPVNFTLFFNAI